MARRALITGIGGQDGSYLAELLLDKGYEVHGLVRDPRRALPNLAGVRERVVLHSGDLADAPSVTAALGTSEPDEVYNLAAVSHVPSAAAAALASAECNALGPVRMLEALVAGGCGARFLQASSSAMFPDSGGVAQDESTPIEPHTPYGAAKAYAHLMTASYRERHDLFACSAILCNHESPRRPPAFVTRRVTRGAAEIKLGLAGELRLGNLEVRRDWGYAPEYVEAMWLMLQAEQPDDYVIGTGTAHSVADLVAAAFTLLDLDPESHLRLDPAALRPQDLGYVLAEPAKAREQLGWTARTGFEGVVRRMVAADLEQLHVAGA